MSIGAAVPAVGGPASAIDYPFQRTGDPRSKPHACRAEGKGARQIIDADKSELNPWSLTLHFVSSGCHSIVTMATFQGGAETALLGDRMSQFYVLYCRASNCVNFIVLMISIRTLVAVVAAAALLAAGAAVGPVSAQTINGCVLKPKTICVGANPKGVNLESANLSGTILTRASLNRANLKKIKLKEAKLIRANMTRVNLTKADLTGANLEHANLTNSDLTKVNLSRANLHSVEMQWDVLTGANLRKANLKNADLSNVKLRDADLTGANLSGANLHGVSSGGITGSPKLPSGWNLIRGYLVGPGADLTGADLTNLDLTNLDLTGVDLWRTNLDGADLTGSNLTNVSSGPTPWGQGCTEITVGMETNRWLPVRSGYESNRGDPAKRIELNWSQFK